MNKIIFFILFLFLIPKAYGLAITPTKLSFDLYGNDFQEKEFVLFNNNDYKTEFKIDANEEFKIIPNKLTLKPDENKKIKVVLETINETGKKYEDRIYIKELNNQNEGINLENALAIKTMINIRDGFKIKEEEISLKEFNPGDVIYEDTIITKYDKNEFEFNAYKLSFICFSCLVFVLLILYIVKRFNHV